MYICIYVGHIRYIGYIGYVGYIGDIGYIGYIRDIEYTLNIKCTNERHTSCKMNWLDGENAKGVGAEQSTCWWKKPWIADVDQDITCFMFVRSFCP